MGSVAYGWIIALGLLWWVVPKWDTVLYDGEFHYLPDRFPTRQAETLFTKAFSENQLGSNIVIVARRENSPEGLLDEDKTYIDETLVPRLKKAHRPDSGQGAADAADAKSRSRLQKRLPEPTRAAAGKNRAGQIDPPALEPVVSGIHTFSDKEFGQLLTSEDQKATLILLELTTDFTERKNEPTIAAVEKLIGKPVRRASCNEKGFPTGLELSLSGIAIVGRDMRDAARKSAHATEAATIFLVIILLVRDLPCADSGGHSAFDRLHFREDRAVDPVASGPGTTGSASSRH